MQTVICMKWGTAYGPEFANTLHSMVSRNTDRPLRFVCFTDDAAGLDRRSSRFRCRRSTLPASHQWKAWRKIALLQRDARRPAGDVLFLDLDVVVTGSIDAFFDFKPEETYCVIENWTQMGEGIGNTSVFRLRIGAHTEVFDTLMADPAGTVKQIPQQPDLLLAHDLAHDLLAGGMVRQLQAHADAALAAEFRQGAVAAARDARRLLHRLPNPDHARDGVGRQRNTGGSALYKHVRPTPWIAEHWR